jgi:hypothetical protein
VDKPDLGVWAGLDFDRTQAPAFERKPLQPNNSSGIDWSNPKAAKAEWFQRNKARLARVRREKAEQRRAALAVGLLKGLPVGVAGRKMGTHCAHGHEFTVENTMVCYSKTPTPHQYRKCRECQRIRQRKYKVALGLPAAS